MKRLSIFLMALLLAGIGANAQSQWTAPQLTASEPTDGGKYYLYNTEAQQYACMGNYKWGTNAIFGDNGLLFTLASVSTTDYDSSSVDAYTLTSSNGQFVYDNEYIYCDGSGKTAGIYFVFTETSTDSKVYKIHGTYAATNTYIGYDPYDSAPSGGYGAGTDVKAVLPALTGTSGQGIEWELYAEDAEELYDALVILYNTLVHAESYGMTDSNEAYQSAGEVYTGGTATEDEVMAAVAALEKAMEEYASVADPDDVTYAFITNPNFDTDISGWTSTTTNDESDFWRNAASHTNGDITIDGFAETWCNSSGALGARTLSLALNELPTGIYRLEADAVAVRQTDENPTVTGVNLYAGTQKTPMHSANGLPEHFTVNFEVAAADATVEIGVEVTSDNNANWVAVDNFRLYYLGAEYEPGDEVHGCEAEFGHWTITDHTTGLFQHNTWSTENDPSGMKTPFIEYWIGSGKELEDATISHYTITGEPGKIYAVSIDYRAFNENSDKKVSQGSTFTANGTSFDLCVGTRSVFEQTEQEDSQEEYAIGYTILCKADETTGAIDVKFDIKDADFDWFAFKDLSIALFDGESWPTLTAATGDMHTGYADAQTTALSAYNSSPSFDTYLAAFNAVNAAQLSHLFYSDIAEALEELEDYLDEAGVAWLEANDAIVAYNNKTLDYQDMTDVYWGAVKQQTTADTNLTDVLLNTKYLAPYANTGTGYAGTYGDDGARESFTGKENNGQYTKDDGKIIYQHIDGLVAGATYKVTFYAVANVAWNDDAATGENIAQIFVNEVTEGITVYSQTSCVPSSYSYTKQVTVGSDGVLEYGIQNIASGGTWYVLQGVSLTLIDSGAITWTMTTAGWGTMILPFAATLPEELTAYSCSSLETDGITLSLTEVGQSIEANTPYIIKGSVEEDTDYSFTGAPTNTANSYTVGMLTGTLVDMNYDALIALSGTVYLLQNHTEEGEGGVAFYPVVETLSADATLTPYHCYLTLTENDLNTTSGAPARLSFSFGDEATGIVAVEGAEAEGNGAIYDLSGRKVSKAVKGVYIQNGKKVLVK